jgi:hypothetical protein
MSAWTLVILPIYAAGSFYAAIVRGQTLSALHLAAFMVPLLMLSLDIVSQSTCKKTSTSRPSVLLSTGNGTRLVLVLASSLVITSPGSATLQQVLLLPLYACVNIFRQRQGRDV